MAPTTVVDITGEWPEERVQRELCKEGQHPVLVVICGQHSFLPHASEFRDYKEILGFDDTILRCYNPTSDGSGK